MPEMTKVVCLLITMWTIIGFLLGFLYSTSLYPESNISTPNVTCPKLPCVTEVTYDCPYEYEEIPDWLELIRKFHYNKTYQTNGYNCRFYSGELVTRLRNMGYEASTVTGRCIGDDDRHMWVRICIDYEPQTGKEQRPECVAGW